MHYYLIRNRQVPWGDYGNIIVYGFISKKGTEIIVERTGPFVPSVYSCNKYIAIVDSAKQELGQHNLKGLNLIKGKKKKIIPVNWQNWDIEKQIPDKPKSGEPEDFILKGRHNGPLADKMEEIWIISPVDTAKGVIDKDVKKVPNAYHHISLNLDNWNGNDVFRTPQLGYIFCTENFKNAVENLPESYLTFVPVLQI